VPARNKEGQNADALPLFSGRCGNFHLKLNTQTLPDRFTFFDFDRYQSGYVVIKKFANGRTPKTMMIKSGMTRMFPWKTMAPLSKKSALLATLD
jgi:hypothetical protein